MPRRRRTKFHAANLYSNVEIQCKNERFVVRLAAIYLRKILQYRPVLDRETLEFTSWVLGPLKDELIVHLSQEIPHKIQEDFHDDINEVEDDIDYAHAIMGAIYKSPKALQRNLLRKAVSLLSTRINDLTYRGLSDIDKTLRNFTKMFGLTDLESELCGFLFCCTTIDNFESYFVDHLKCNTLLKRRYLEAILQCGKNKLKHILSGNMAALEMIENSSGIFRLADDYIDFFDYRENLVQNKKLYRKILGKTLPLDYHLIDPAQTDHLTKLLKAKGNTPTSILLYGPPGTGKTTFAKSLIQSAGLMGYEVVQGTDNEGGKRRAAIVACLNMTQSSDNSVVVIDEADSVLNTESSWLSRGETLDKGWLNQLLEKPGTKTIWITNQIDQIESSVCRRFAFSLFFKPFNRRQRIQLWGNIIKKNRVKRFFLQNVVERLASQHKLSAGIIDLAVQKATQIKPDGKKDFVKAVELGLYSHTSLLNGGEKNVDKEKIEKNYSLEGLNIQGDINAVVTQLERFDSFLRKDAPGKILNMNLLFYGPPGTGKSELARYLANHLDREIICKRTSDLQSKWVGESEKLIKDSFAEAEREESILVIDEADSLLFSRDRATKSWEISFTNEFLTQMERFRGILVCTTNRLKDLDMASIRRFNHKIDFDYLTPEGNTIFYKKMLSPLIFMPVTELDRQAIKGIAMLSPGDFKTVRDRFSFYPEDEISNNILINALQEESRIKTIHLDKRAIGF